MTDERRTAINQRLAEFEGLIIQQFPEWTKYCDDLNALARLEGKLPPHHWYLLADEKRASAELWFFEYVAKPVVEDTEAEARAEAICKYLESKP